MIEFDNNPQEQSADSVPKGTETSTNEVLDKPDLAKDVALRLDTELPDLSKWEKTKEPGLRGELSKERVAQFNEYANAHKTENGMVNQPGMRLALIHSIANDPAIRQEFPELCRIIDKVGCLNDDPQLTREKFSAAMNEAKTALDNAGFYLNSDAVMTGELLIPVEWRMMPTKEKITALFGNDIPELQPATVINDPSLNKQGYQIAGYGLLNVGNIQQNMDNYSKAWRFTDKMAAGLDMESINQATVNHEESHRVLKEAYNFPARQAMQPEEGAKWMAEGNSFVPNNTAQIDEFLAHSVGQSTDKYEIITNIGNALMNLKQDPNDGKTTYELGDPNDDYALLQHFVMEEVAKIFEERGVPNFKGRVENLTTQYNSEVVNYNNAYDRLDKDIANAREDGNEGEAMKLEAEKEHALKTLNGERRGKFLDFGWNYVTKDITSSLTDADYQRISDKCMTQAKKYLSQIESTYGKKQAPAASPTATV